MLVLPAYAKLNLGLAVLARRDDGWHDIDSIVVSIDWHDLVGLNVRSSSEPGVALRVTGVAASGVPSGGENIAARAARALIDAAARPLTVTVWLDKRVATAAGLGGGSADAAAVLRAGTLLLQSQGIAFDSARLDGAAAELGSDVPALSSRDVKRVTRRGDVVSSMTAVRLHVVVAVGGTSSTAATYAAVAPDEMSDSARIDKLHAEIAGGMRPSDSLMGSALEPAAVRANPALGDSFMRIRRADPGHQWHMTGSGGALFALTGDAREAIEAAQRLRSAGFSALACASFGSTAEAPAVP